MAFSAVGASESSVVFSFNPAGGQAHDSSIGVGPSRTISAGTDASFDGLEPADTRWMSDYTLQPVRLQGRAGRQFV